MNKNSSKQVFSQKFMKKLDKPKKVQVFAIVIDYLDELADSEEDAVFKAIEWWDSEKAEKLRTGGYLSGGTATEKYGQWVVNLRFDRETRSDLLEDFRREAENNDK